MSKELHQHIKASLKSLRHGTKPSEAFSKHILHSLPATVVTTPPPTRSSVVKESSGWGRWVVGFAVVVPVMLFFLINTIIPAGGQPVVIDILAFEAEASEIDQEMWEASLDELETEMELDLIDIETSE